MMVNTLRREHQESLAFCFLRTNIKKPMQPLEMESHGNSKYEPPAVLPVLELVRQPHELQSV